MIAKKMQSKRWKKIIKQKQQSMKLKIFLKKAIKKINKTKSWIFRESNQIDKPQLG